jgi:hypothetical protein
MTEQSQAKNLTGVWNGLYSYPDGVSVSFVATLIESGSSLTGSTHEPSMLGNGNTANATLAGARLASSVTFVKTYDRAELLYRDPVDYDGILNGDATEIEGRWSIRATWSGRFLMIRATGRTKALALKAAERA